MLSILSNINIISVLGFLAFLINIIVQLIKNLKYIKDVPTDLVTIITSLIVTMGCSLTYFQMSGTHIDISCIVVPLVASFPIAFISMYGFETFKKLYERFNIK